MKKWILILVSVLLLVTLTAGCSKKSQPSLDSSIVTPGAALEVPDTEEDNASHAVQGETPSDEAENNDDNAAQQGAPEDKEDAPKENSSKNEDTSEESDKKEPVKTPESSGDIIAGGLWDGGPVTWEISSDGVLTIAGNRSVQAKQKYIWWDYGDTVTKVVIEEGITNVPESAFSGMEKLREVSLSNTVKTIEEGAFANCPALTAVTIPASVQTIEASAFSHCAALTTVSFASGGTGLTIGQYAFAGSGLTSFTAPPHLRTIESYAFTKCSQLETVRLEGGVSTVRARAFEECGALKHLVLGQSLTNCDGYIFNGCSAITTVENYSPSLFDDFIHMPNLTTVVVGGSRDSTGRFYGCPKLQNVTIGGNITKISDLAFDRCPSLTAITIPNTVSTIGGDAFRETGLTTLTIPASVTSIDSFVFSGTPLREIIFTGDAPTMSATNTFYEKSLTAYYPANNPTWTADVLQNYGGTITWVGQ